MIRAHLRQAFAFAHALPLMDRLHFLISTASNYRQNRRFRKSHPEFHLPPDRLLHETYRLDYHSYAQDGIETASELIERCRPFLSDSPIDILEWGCGVSRITRHLPEIPDIRSVTGADINAEMIQWNAKHIPTVAFHLIAPLPPTPFEPDSFNVILAVSVLTHIPHERQITWLQEASRILKPNGILLMTSHGRAFLEKLTKREQESLSRQGSLTRNYPKTGHRMMATFHEPLSLRKVLEGLFEILDFRDGAVDQKAAGGQDLWLLRKKS